MYLVTQFWEGEEYRLHWYSSEANAKADIENNGWSPEYLQLYKVDSQCSLSDVRRPF